MPISAEVGKLHRPRHRSGGQHRRLAAGRRWRTPPGARGRDRRLRAAAQRQDRRLAASPAPRRVGRSGDPVPDRLPCPGLASAQGFVTNIGGVATLPVAIPANIAGVAIVQMRMVAAIAHLRGYDLNDNRVRTALVMCLLGGEQVANRIAAGQLPTSPMAVATAPMFDPELDRSGRRGSGRRSGRPDRRKEPGAGGHQADTAGRRRYRRGDGCHRHPSDRQLRQGRAAAAPRSLSRARLDKGAELAPLDDTGKPDLS